MTAAATATAFRRVATPAPGVSDKRKAVAAAEEIAAIVATATARSYLTAEPTPIATSNSLTAKDIQRIVAESSREAKAAAEEIASIVATATTRSHLTGKPTPTATTNILTAKDVQRIVATSVASWEDLEYAQAQTYESPSGRWSIRYPEEWISLVVNVPFSERIRFAGMLGDSNDPAIAIVEVERVPDGGLLPLAESSDALILANLGLLENFRLLSRSTQVIRGALAEELVFSHDVAFLSFTGLMIIVRSTSDLYTIQGLASSSQFNDIEEQIRDIVYSFRILDG